MDRGAWQATVHGVIKSQTRLSNENFHFSHTGTQILVLRTISFSTEGTTVEMTISKAQTGSIQDVLRTTDCVREERSTYKRMGHLGQVYELT